MALILKLSIGCLVCPRLIVGGVFVGKWNNPSICPSSQRGWMSFEIERKFLLCGDEWQQLATSRISIRQAYLASNEKSSVRVRIKGDGTATLTVKSRPVDLRRLELEYPVPALEAEALM